MSWLNSIWIRVFYAIFIPISKLFFLYLYEVIRKYKSKIQICIQQIDKDLDLCEHASCYIKDIVHTIQNESVAISFYSKQ